MSATRALDASVAGYLVALGISQRKLASVTGLTRYNVEQSLAAAKANRDHVAWLGRVLELWKLCSPAPQESTE